MRASTCAAAIRVDVDPAGDPPHGALGATRPVHQPEHEPGADHHHDHADHRDCAVQRVDAADRDRHEQCDPQDQVEHNRRPEADRSEREAGVGAGDARQRHQPVPERRTGGTAAGHDARQRARAHLDPEQPPRRQVGTRVSQRGLHQRRVAVQRHHLERKPDDQQPRIDPTEILERVPEVGSERHHEVVRDGENDQQLERQPEPATRRLLG